MEILRFNQYFEGYLDRKQYKVAKTSWLDYRDDIEYILKNAGDDYPYKVQTGGNRMSKQSLGDGLGTRDKRNIIRKMYDFLTGEKDNIYVFFEFENTDGENDKFISVMVEVVNRIKHYHENDITIAFLGEEEEDTGQPFLTAPPTVLWSAAKLFKGLNKLSLEDRLDKVNWDHFGNITRCKFSISNAIPDTIPADNYIYGNTFNNR
jgi:hypothetical protein